MAEVIRKADIDKNNDSKEVYIKKSNALINIKPQQKHTLQQTRFIIWTSSYVDKEKVQTGDELKLSAHEFAALVQVDPSNIYREGKDFSNEIMTKTISMEDKLNDSWQIVHWYDHMRYEEGYFYLKFNEVILEHLSNLKSSYTRYPMMIALSMNSQYAIRLYELLSQYRKIGKRVFQYDELREKLAVKPNELKQFSHFKAKVLDISVREINSKSELRIDWTPKKKGRRYNKIEFSIKVVDIPIKMEDIEQEIKQPTLEDDINRIKTRLLGHGMTNAIADKLLEQYGASRVLEKLDYTEYLMKNDKKISNPPGYIATAVRDNYIIDVESSVKEASTTVQPVSVKNKRIQEVLVEISRCQGALNGPLVLANHEMKKEYEENLEQYVKELSELRGND